jgi:hypothetical protein
MYLQNISCLVLPITVARQRRQYACSVAKSAAMPNPLNGQTTYHRAIDMPTLAETGQ